jgi:hypothetical protein
MGLCRWCVEAFLAAVVFWAPWQLLDYLKHRLVSAYRTRRESVNR